MQLLEKLQKQVASLEHEMSGFDKTVDELRAAGRVEAMEDMMNGLLGDLVRVSFRLFGL